MSYNETTRPDKSSLRFMRNMSHPTNYLLFRATAYAAHRGNGCAAHIIANQFLHHFPDLLIALYTFVFLKTLVVYSCLIVLCLLKRQSRKAQLMTYCRKRHIAFFTRLGPISHTFAPSLRLPHEHFCVSLRSLSYSMCTYSACIAGPGAQL